MPLEVIGAGLGRTGTESLKRALEMLGYGPCYHMYEVLPNMERVTTWRGIYTGSVTPDWDHVFDGYRATVDWPAAQYWRELAQACPKAKVVLSVRSPESWLASMEGTILPVIRGEDDPGKLPALIGKALLDGRYDDPEHIMDAFRRHTTEVQATIAPERLLTYELGSGWEPLCAHLGCDVPGVPYPIGNDAEQFQQRRTSLEVAREGKD